MRIRTYGAAALLLTVSLGAAACGDDGHSRADYVAVMSKAGSGFSADEAKCAAGALVDVVGVDNLEKADAFQKIQDNPDGNLSDYGITLDEAQGPELFAGLNDCKDMRQFFTEAMSSGGGLPAEAASCVVDGIDDATFSSMIIASFMDGEAAMDANPEFQGAIEQAATDCASSGVDMGL
ncbi:MAG TPA: hypothetical protein VH479_18205 [Acidimicrobiales bacterium]